MKKIEDYLHLYGLGAEVMFDSKRWKVIHIKRRTIRIVRIVGDEGYNKWNECNYEECKMILRPLSSMTKKECNVYNRLRGTLFHMADMTNGVMQEAAAIKYLYSLHIDVHGLIDAGLAIDKTTQP